MTGSGQPAVRGVDVNAWPESAVLPSAPLIKRCSPARLRLRRLRERHIAGAEDSQHSSRTRWTSPSRSRLADKAAPEDTLDENADAILGPRIGALTQVFALYAPPDSPAIAGNVVRDVDQLVKDFAFDGWTDSMQASRELKRVLRLLLKDRYGLPPTGDVFDKAYEHIAANYGPPMAPRRWRTWHLWRKAYDSLFAPV